MKKSKVLLLTLCAVALVAASVVGTLAYLTSQDTVVNTFTVGKVDIALNEAKVTPDGKLDGTERVKTNDYHLLPGMTYVKDPTVTVIKGSEESYVRMILHITDRADVIDVFGADFKVEDILTGYDTTVWVPTSRVDDETNDIISYEFRYKEPVTTLEQEEDEVLASLFTGFTVPGALKNDEMAKLVGMQIVIEGHAIQTATFTAADYTAEGITDEEAAKLAVDAAWAAFSEQYTTVAP